APSRAVLLTGKYSHLNGVADNRTAFDGSQLTFPKILQQVGYETALFGKWHLKSDPTGFDYWNILPGQGQYYNPDMIEMGEQKQIQGHSTDIITDICLDWLKNRQRSKPFCALLHYKAPHRNWMPKLEHLSMYQDKELPIPETFFDDYQTRSDAAQEQEMRIADHTFPAFDLKLSYQNEPVTEAEKQDQEFWDSAYSRMNAEQQKIWDAAYQPQNEKFRANPPQGDELAKWKYQRYIKDYLRTVAGVDENIGKVLDYLDEAGLSQNTLVVYTSDQGFYLGEHGWFDKRFMYEQSLRMPLIVRYPREIQPAVNENDIVLNLDFAPTLLDYCDAPIPGEMQGRSLRKLLRGAKPGDWRQSMYYHYSEYPAWHMVKKHYGIRTHRYKLIHFYDDIDAWELYDLKTDPYEINNVYQNPDYQSIVKELKLELNRLKAEYRDL
ncbi:MAG TPA: DUF4976 domain-containing protein, partial [bacterium]|nr:DUF4976 domain-containing protein [bacterium]